MLKDMAMTFVIRANLSVVCAFADKALKAWKP